jgi:hypothetical protein
VNPYLYVGGNPVGWVDPWGLSAASQASFRNVGATLGFLLSLPVDAFEDLPSFGAGVLANPITTAGMMAGGAALGTVVDALLNGPALVQDNDDQCASKGGRGKTFRGGTKQSRDYWGKYEKETEFKRWWHRQGKKKFGDRDMEPDQVERMYRYWKSLGKPRAK